MNYAMTSVLNNLSIYGWNDIELKNIKMLHSNTLKILCRWASIKLILNEGHDLLHVLKLSLIDVLRLAKLKQKREKMEPLPALCC